MPVAEIHALQMAISFESFAHPDGVTEVGKEAMVGVMVRGVEGSKEVIGSCGCCNK